MQDEEPGSSLSFADGGEILDGIVTRSRGEVKHMCSPKVTSSSATPAMDLILQSPRFSEKAAYSPRVTELRRVSSAIGRGPQSPSGPSTLGISPRT